MDDVISRRAAIGTLMSIVKSASLRNRNVYSTAKRCLFEIEAIPTVDAVPVVRCKDCKHNNLPRSAGNADCELFYGMTDACGFCHKGEWREEDG